MSKSSWAGLVLSIVFAGLAIVGVVTDQLWAVLAAGGAGVLACGFLALG
jgi:hypothetical protein